jgi:exosortase K
MRPRSIKFTHLAQLAVVLLCAVTLKQYYSSANVNELRWILAPTTVMVELVTGERFVFESFAGYMSSDRSFLIASSCSGVNFLLSAFLLLTLSKLWRGRDQKISWNFIPIAAVVAYLATIIANTARIATALHLRTFDSELIWLNPDQLHRFEGIVIYFGCLMLLFFASRRLGSDTRSRDRSVARLLRRSLLPLVVYYSITIGVPVITTFYRGGKFTGFWEHSLFVLLTPIVILVPLIAFRAVKDHRLFRSEPPYLSERY